MKSRISIALALAGVGVWHQYAGNRILKERFQEAALSALEGKITASPEDIPPGKRFFQALAALQMIIEGYLYIQILL